MKNTKRILRAAVLLLAALAMASLLSGCTFGYNAIGYIDREGNTVIPGVYQMVQPFHEGLAAVMLGEADDAYWGYANKDARQQIGFSYAAARPFYDGCAPVEVRGKNGKNYWVYIDPQGNEIFDGAKFGDASVFVDGLAPVADFDTGLYGYINREGEMVAPCQYDLASVFSETDHMALIREGGENLGLCGYINENFETVIEPKYYYGGTFTNGYAVVKLSADMEMPDWGFIDTTGEMVLGGDYAECDVFSEGMAPVAVKKDGKTLWGYIDTTGAWVIEPKYEMALSFSEGVAGVQMPDGDKLCGFIDTTGAFVLEPQFTDISDFSEGLAAVQGGCLEKGK